MGKMETELKEWFDQYRYDNLKRIGLAGTMKAYYLDLIPKIDTLEPKEMADKLGLNNYEFTTWQHIWFDKDSWFNQQNS